LGLVERRGGRKEERRYLGIARIQRDRILLLEMGGRGDPMYFDQWRY
jgi:hypothetical protein